MSKSNATKKNPFGGSISRLSISQPCSLIDRDFCNESPQNQDSIENLDIFNNKTDEEKMKSLTPIVGDEKKDNVTSVEVSWAAKESPNSSPNISSRDDDDLTSLAEVERKRDQVRDESSEKDEGSVLSCSSIPVDFGDSLPPNLTTLVNKRFCLYRLNKAEDTELGVLITKKLNRDRRTSGKQKYYQVCKFIVYFFNLY